MVRKNILRKIEIMKKSLKEAKIAQLNAPSAMESHSDTTKSEMEKLVTALEIDISRQKNYLSLVPNNLTPSNQKIELWKNVRVNNKGILMNIIIVPDGMGGDTIDGIRLVSETTPLVLQIKKGEIEVLEVR
ncbi:MAG: hypothetical protein UU93_C0007G0050 [Candidatus Amesbacteria bacterium GW2011_GWA2_42_12]|uniref:Uncharacterized protein n=1 Tax=Candidatus Amesbacteria bacterium GW2011_GWA2_42_12 TaxID=1618356 RepID=A0A0G0Y6R1_9BACT|nr:MAG: hypothetical protein UU93_C0007G0050 [Candidatus Amesbacteria bacterium GW2011_GWA2_42_12]